MPSKAVSILAVAVTLTFPALARSADPVADADPAERAALSWSRAPLEGPLVADRPDFTESVDAVPRGRIQLEAGYTYTDAGRGAESHAFPETLLRIGLVDDLELRIEWPTYARLDNGATTDGLEDLVLGFKYKLIEQRGIIPHLGVIGQLSVPTGASGLTSDDTDPEIKLLWAYDLTERLEIGGNINAAWPTDSDGRFFEPAASIAAGYGLTERLGLFAEYFGFYPDRGGPTHFFNGGATYHVTDNFQLDVRAGFGLNSRSDDFFTGAGFSVRF